MKLAYFVHDLTEPAVRRRVSMLKAGGADIVVLGFRREDSPPEDLEGCRVVDLGRTYDARLAQRASQVLKAVATSGRLKTEIARADVILARSLEMLAVAHAARRSAGRNAPIVYECLDIHRMMLSNRLAGRGLRAVERALVARSAMLIVSSPAFVTHYFQAIQGFGRDSHLAILLVENKPLHLKREEVRPLPRKPPAPPWRIGWYGAVRCQRSLDMLVALAARRPELLQVIIRGRPFWGGFRDFTQQVTGARNVDFGGPYVAADLPALYGDVHFSWAIDYYEAGGNSDWLLPNRIYESAYFGAVPIALAGVETGRWLQRRGVGVVMDDPEQELEAFLDGLAMEPYSRDLEALSRMSPAGLAADQAECTALVARLQDAGRARRGMITTLEG